MVIALLALPFAPLLAGFALVAAGRRPRAVGRTTSFVVAALVAAATLALSLYVGVERPEVDRSWVPSLGLRFHLGVDGISVPLLVLTAAVGLLAVLHRRTEPPAQPASGPTNEQAAGPTNEQAAGPTSEQAAGSTSEQQATGSAATYFGCVLIVIGGALLTFLARDAILFFIAFETVLVPMWVLIGLFGDQRDPAATRRAALTFVLYTVLGSTLMLTGILVLVFSAGTADLTVLGRGVTLGSAQQTSIAALLLAGFAVKVPLWPVHSWLPAAHTAAPTGGSMLLAAVLLKLGTYGVVRLLVGPLRDGWHTLAPLVGILAVIGIIWAGLVCLVEPSLKRVIAYSSVAHMGVVMLALATGTELGLKAALWGNISHGLIAALLFAIAGGLKTRWHGDRLDEPRPGVRDVSPRLGFALLLGLGASLGLPALAGFWAEFLTLLAAWQPTGERSLFKVLAAVAALGAVLGAAYSLRIARAVWAGSTDGAEAGVLEQAPWRDASGLEWVVIGSLLVAVVVLGVWPTGLLDLMAPAIAELGAPR